MTNFVAPVYDKSDQDTTRLLQLWKESFLTNTLSLSDQETLAAAMQLQSFTMDQSIIRYGDIGDKYYVLKSGTVKVKVYQPGTTLKDSIVIIEKQLSVLTQDAPVVGFGEIALLMNDKRTASVICESPCEAWTLSADVFKHTIASNTLRRRNINLTYLNQVELFKTLETYEKLKLIDGLKVKSFTKGDFAIHQGQQGEEFFIIEKGQCECIKETNGEF